MDPKLQVLTVKRILSREEILMQALFEAIDAMGYADEFYDHRTGGPVTPKNESLAELADRLQRTLNQLMASP